MIVVIDCHLSVTSYSPRTIYSADYIMISFKMNIIYIKHWSDLLLLHKNLLLKELMNYAKNIISIIMH